MTDSRGPNRKQRLFTKLEELKAGGPKRSLGQNFLISDSVIEKILFAVRAESFSEIIEVGPGLGALTDDLIEIARAQNTRVTLIELDKVFAQAWRSVAAMGPMDSAGASHSGVADPVTQIADSAAQATDSAAQAAPAENSTSPSFGVRVFEADALQMDWKALHLNARTVFVSNLPYQISSSIAIERSIAPAGISRMILMFQKEVAQRIGARAKTPEYGLLTVIIQAFWETSTVADAGPKDFHPAPNVASRVLVFRRRSEPDFGTHGTSTGFLRFAKAGFSHRRKLLAKNLASTFNTADSTAKLADAFTQMKLLPTARAEELTPAQFVELYRLAHG